MSPVPCSGTLNPHQLLHFSLPGIFLWYIPLFKHTGLIEIKHLSEIDSHLAKKKKCERRWRPISRTDGAPHRTERPTGETEGRAGLMGKRDEASAAGWMERERGQSSIAVAGSASLLSVLASSSIERQAFRGIETHGRQPCLGNWAKS